MEQKAAFHPARGGATLFSSLQGAPGGFRGNQYPDVGRGLEEISSRVEFGTGAFSLEPRVSTCGSGS